MHSSPSFLLWQLAISIRKDLVGLCPMLDRTSSWGGIAGEPWGYSTVGAPSISPPSPGVLWPRLYFQGGMDGAAPSPKEWVSWEGQWVWD